MKKREFASAISNLPYSLPDTGSAAWERRNRLFRHLTKVTEKFEARLGGSRGVEDARDRFYTGLKRIYARPATPGHLPHEHRLASWKVRSALSLAALAGEQYDEHGSRSGDYLTTRGIDYISPRESAPAPYCDAGDAGLGLIEIERTRVYAGHKWRPSSVATRYLVGRNEAGTYFSHPISPNCRTVLDAVQWIWNGQAERIIQRQGDVALIAGNGGPKLPPLPRGHKVDGDQIVHDTHSPLPCPGKGQRIIIGRRAAERASSATRD